MLLSLMLTLISLLSFAYADQCPSYFCTDKLPSSQCIAFSYPYQYYLNPCDQDLNCNISAKSNSSCINNELESNRYPGDLCSLDIECITKNCFLGICQGPNINEPCSLGVCMPGAFCNSGICVEQVKIGGACKDEYDCVNNALCDSGFCIEYWSLDIGEITSSVSVEGFSMACTSGFASPQGDKFVCANPPLSASTALPIECELGTLCTSADGLYSQECACGFNSNGNGYCPLFPGDPYVQSAIQDSVAVLSINSGCNTHSRFSFNCFANFPIEDQKTFLNFALNLTLIRDGYFPEVQENPYCVKEIFTNFYWNMYNTLQVISYPQCPRYFCSNSTDEWDQLQCIQYRKDIYESDVLNTYYVHPCDNSGLTCPSSSFQNSTCAEPPPKNLHPGDYCKENSDCQSGVCQQNFCLGKRNGDFCEYIHDCMPGYFCNTTLMLCQDLQVEGQYCSLTYECANYLICDQKACIAYYSLDIGEITDNADFNGFSQSCASGFAVPFQNGLFKCAEPPVSNEWPDQCRPGVDICYDKTGNFSKPCTCGFTEDGESFCPLFEGDSPLQNAIANQNTLLEINQICNTVSRFSENCFLQTKDYLGVYYDYILNLTEYMYYPYLQGNSYCVKEVYTYNFWRLVEEEIKWDKDEKDDHPGDHDDDEIAIQLICSGILLNLI
ncbi:unnamed protein product [Blepharisma stoltei]|uniref:EGF-like domain-containing protein n=1 Tax=Blepharisma stoltei TaxID=1481888 RepID=A0AAU9JVQ1_9CILI|nr:unnamed protein product [Blepharisma stoltei]